jgi:hypothetical protein
MLERSAASMATARRRTVVPFGRYEFERLICRGAVHLEVGGPAEDAVVHAGDVRSGEVRVRNLCRQLDFPGLVVHDATASEPRANDPPAQRDEQQRW